MEIMAAPDLSDTLILGLELAGRRYRPDKAAAKQQSGQQKRSAKACIEDCDKLLRRQAAGPQADTAGHHHGHDSEGLAVKEFKKKLALFQIGENPGGMFFNQLSENKYLKYGKDQDGQQKIPHSTIGGVGGQADAQNIKACGAPYQTGQKQQGFSFYFHEVPPLL